MIEPGVEADDRGIVKTFSHSYLAKRRSYSLPEVVSRRSNLGRVNERLTNIQKTVEKAAECPAIHLESVAVMEGFRNQTMWEGMVEIFALKGHAKAKRAYSWQTGDGQDAQFTAVLEMPPVDSANTAVRVAIAAKARHEQKD